MEKYISEELQDLIWSEARTWFVGWLQEQARILSARNKHFETAMNVAERATNTDLDGDGDIAQPGVGQ